MPKKKRMLYLVAVVVFFLLIGVGRAVITWQQDREPSSPTPPPGANLRVDLFVERLYHATGQREPLMAELEDATLHCPNKLVWERDDLSYPGWYPGWCNTVAINNFPLRTDASGYAVLWFRVDPPPLHFGVVIIREPLGAPGVAVVFPNVLVDGLVGERYRPTLKPEILAPDHWRVRATILTPSGKNLL